MIDPLTVSFDVIHGGTLLIHIVIRSQALSQA